MTNSKSDRHVVAAAVMAHAQVIVTFNLKHFTRKDLEPWDIEAQHPDYFLSHLFDLEPLLLLQIIEEQSADLTGMSVTDLLLRLSKHVPNFVSQIRTLADL